MARALNPADIVFTITQPDYSGVEALLTNLPRTLVGDGKTPNIFFVTNEVTGNVVAVFMGDDKQEAAIAFADGRTEPLMVEDRLTGVVHDNPAGEALQDRLRDAEAGYQFDKCPNCRSSNIANEEGPDEDGRLQVTCHDCSYQWTETPFENRLPKDRRKEKSA